MNKDIKKKQRRIKPTTAFTILAVILIIIFSFTIAPITLQNDTFYTIKIGEKIMNDGIDMQDPFSWHENLPYTYPHWLYDFITYIIFSISGFVGIYVVTALLSVTLGITIFWVNKKLTKNELISFVVTLGAIYLLKSYIAARAQLVTFILFAIELYCIEKFLENKKKRYAAGLILISILIANLHSATWPFFFVIFLPYIGEYFIANMADIILYRKVQMKYKKVKLKILLKKNKKQDKINKLKEEIESEKLYIEKVKNKRAEYNENPYKIKINNNKNVKWLIIVMLLCGLTGLLTPQTTYEPYTHIFKLMRGNTTQNINEHQPTTLIKEQEIMCAFTLFLALLIFTNTKIRLCDLFMLLGLTFLTFYSKRQISIFAIMCSVILTRMLSETLENYFKGFHEKALQVFTTLFGMYSIIVIVLIMSFSFIKDKKGAQIIDEGSYPAAACDYILENVDTRNMRLYNDYNFGSYILYRGIPVFIDSRCDLYSPEFNSPTGDPKDGQDIFMDFINTSQGATYCEDTFRKYGITHILVPTNSKVNIAIQKSNSRIYNKLYSDNNFVFYERIVE